MNSVRQNLERPIYLDGAPPADLAAAVKAAASDARCETCGRVPMLGVIGATLFGVTAAYFAPAVFDWLGARLGGDDTGDTVEFEVEP